MDAGPEIEHHHHHTGHRLLDIVLGVSAILISLISLYLAIQHGKTMEHMVEATTWPNLEVATSNAEPDGGHLISLVVRNTGVGPARVDSFEVMLGGVPLASGAELLRSCCAPPGTEPRPHYISSSVIGTVIPAREMVTYFRAAPEQMTPEQYARLDDARTRLTWKICYCSALDECWTRDGEARHPERVKACPKPKVGYEG